METSFSYTGKFGYFSSDEKKMISKVLKLSKEYPELVRILAFPEDNDGCLYCQLPSEWLKIAPKRRVTFTDEQRLAAKQRLLAARKTTTQQED